MNIMTENTQQHKEEDKELPQEETKIPEIAQKRVSKFGPAQFQNGSKFGK